MEESAFGNEIALYPNPATSQVTIAFPKTLKAEIRVFDITGKLLIYEAEAVIANDHKVDVSTLSAGTYFVRINSEAGSATKQLLIN